MTFHKGSKVFYILEQGLDTKFIPAVVHSVGPKRITIRDEKGGMQRIVGPNKLLNRQEDKPLKDKHPEDCSCIFHRR